MDQTEKGTLALVITVLTGFIMIPTIIAGFGEDGTFFGTAILLGYVGIGIVTIGISRLLWSFILSEAGSPPSVWGAVLMVFFWPIVLGLGLIGAFARIMIELVF